MRAMHVKADQESRSTSPDRGIGASPAPHARAPLVTGLAVAAVLASHAGTADAQECRVRDPITTSGVPAELADKRMTVLFEESFDGLDTVAMDRGASCSTGTQAACADLPGNWDYFYSNERWHPDDAGDSSLHPSLEITDAVFRGAGGKSMRIWDESWGSNGMWGSDGILAKDLPPSKHVYIEMQVKFQPGFRWMAVEEGFGQDAIKLLRLAHFDGEDDESRFSFFTGGTAGPFTMVFYKNWLTSNGKHLARINNPYFCGPPDTLKNFRCGSDTRLDRPEASLPGSPDFVGSLGDGGWHKIGMRAKMNSAPGVRDGQVTVWVDDQQVLDTTDIPWLGPDSDGDEGWDLLLVGGNADNYPEPESARFEQWWAIDDVRAYAID